ncbi:hypothetical protein HRG_012085 [Hirsutella rhossiliensis]
MLYIRCHKWYTELNDKHGLIGLRTIFVNLSFDVRLHVNTRPGYKRSDWYYNACCLEHWRDIVFSKRGNRKHNFWRKQTVSGVGLLPFLTKGRLAVPILDLT